MVDLERAKAVTIKFRSTPEARSYLTTHGFKKCIPGSACYTRTITDNVVAYVSKYSQTEIYITLVYREQ
jgi:hypothetical protein